MPLASGNDGPGCVRSESAPLEGETPGSRPPMSPIGIGAAAH